MSCNSTQTEEFVRVQAPAISALAMFFLLKLNLCMAWAWHLAILLKLDLEPRIFSMSGSRG
jgi:hypothetical protein